MCCVQILFCLFIVQSFYGQRMPYHCMAIDVSLNKFDGGGQSSRIKPQGDDRKLRVLKSDTGVRYDHQKQMLRPG